MPALRNSFPSNNGSNGTVTVAAPTGLADNDLVLLFINTAEDVVTTAPGGFVRVAEITGTSHATLFAKVAASEPTEYTLRWTGTGNGTVIACAVDPTTLTYVGVHQVATASSNVASANKVWNGVTNTDTNTELLCFGSFGSSAASTPDGAMTERVDGNNPRVYMMSQAVVAAGATGTRTATGSSVTTQRCITVSITESAVYPITYPEEVWVTAAPVLVELTGEGAQTTQAMVLAEIAARGIYLTEAPVLVEVAALGIYLTAAPILIEFEYVEPLPTMPTSFPTSAGTRRMHRTLPDEVTGYAFDPEFSWWSTIVAEESTNLLINPSFERLVGLSETDQYLVDGVGFVNLDYMEYGPVGATAGRNCARITIASGTGWLYYFIGVACTPGPYTFSCDVYVTRTPMAVALSVLDGADNVYGQRTFIVHNTGWQRLSMTYVEGGSGVRIPRLTVTNEAVNNVYVYTDAWQFEKKAYATTYLDGDMIGFQDSAPYQSYYWHGEPHLSLSTRRERTGSGGRVVNWSEEARFKTTSIIGLGMASVEQRTQTLGDGREVHLGSDAKGRDFTITGRIFASNPRHLIHRHNDLIRLLKPNNTLGGDQMVLRFQEVDDNEKLIGAPLDIVCIYREGLQGNITGLYQETLPMQFRAVQPFPMDTIESSAELQLRLSLADNSLVFRDEYGEFMNLSTDIIIGGVVVRVGFMRDGRIVALGNYTQIGGDFINYAAYWDGEDWQALGAGTAPSGPTDIDDGFKLGYPLTVGTVGGDVMEYQEDTDSWVQLGGTGFLGSIHAIHRDTNGDVWVGGIFEFADDGTTRYNNVAKYNASTGDWEKVGGGLVDTFDVFDEDLMVSSVLADNDGNVYFGGTFGVAKNIDDPFSSVELTKGVARWNTKTQLWERVGTGLFGNVKTLIRAVDGYIYAVGNFPTDAGIQPYPLRGFARFNGYVWEEVLPITRQDGDYGAEGMIQDEDGVFWFYNYTADTALDLFDIEGLGEVGFFGYRDGILYPPYIQDVGMMHMALGPGGQMMYITHHHVEGDSVYAPAMNEIEYAGSADAPLAVHIHGPGRFVQMLQRTTRGGVYGRETGFLLSENEEMLIRTDSQRTMVYSNQRFNMQTQIAAGPSNLKALRLRPGLNRISLFVTDLSEGVEGWLTWRNRFWSLEDGRG